MVGLIENMSGFVCPHCNEISDIFKSGGGDKLAEKTGVALLDPEVTYLGGRIKKLAGNDFKVIYDCERWREGIEDIMDTADYFIPSSEFLAAEELGFHNLAFNEKIIKKRECKS